MKRKIRVCALIMAYVCLLLMILWPLKKETLSEIILSDAVTTNGSVSHKNVTIVIDAGHGGNDPGKIGMNGLLEKDVNLKIAYKVKALLESEGIRVVMTRTSDEALHSGTEDNKKAADMTNRCKMIEEADPIFTVSIHQNSYTQPSVKGAQVFYYTPSEEGKQLAQVIQRSLIQRLDKENHRKATANDSYYLLKKTPTPTVIVECGFLSNPIEAQALQTDAYQHQVAFSIHMGIMQYLNVYITPNS